MQIVRTRLVLLCSGLLAVGPACADDENGNNAKKKDAGQPQTARIGNPAPDFTLLDCLGNKHTLSDYKNKVVVLEWVSQECPWSIKAIPVMKKLREKHDKKGIVWLGIESTHWRKPEESVKYIKDRKLAFPILMDNDGKVGRMYHAKTTPHVYVIDKGRLVYAGGLHNNQHGKKKESEVRNYVDEALRAVLDGQEVPVAETKPWGCSVKYKKADKKVERKDEN